MDNDPNTDAGVEGGVGLTALMVAAARAIETHRADSLAQDFYAEHFIRAARAPASWPVRIEEVPDGDANPLWGRFARYFGLRTRVFDDFLLRRAHHGARQIVLLGAGLDARAFRLDWPADRVVFELDRPEVLAFKGRVLDDLGATPKAARRAVPVDLREEWTAGLIEAGFDPGAPSAWLAEGVLLYLPRAAEQRLIDAVDRLAVGGSALAFEIKLGTNSPQIHENPLYRSTKHQIGVDLPALFDAEPRPDSTVELAGRGWSTVNRTPFDFTRQHSQGPRPQHNDPLGGNQWVFATKLDTARLT